MRGTGRILMGELIEVRMGVVSMARYLGGGYVVVLKAGGKGIEWQAMRGAGLCRSDTSQRLRTNGKP